jgi:hypothetical protein
LIAQEILSDSNDTSDTQTANQPSMLSLGKQEIDRIAPVLSEESKPLSSDEIVRRVAKLACERICRRLIRAYRRMHHKLSGDDSPLVNVWEEICVQEQQERAFSWEDAYEASLLGFLEGEVDALDEATRWAIWHQTDAGIDWSVDDNEPPEEWSSEELGRFILEEYVLPAAGAYSNARIRRYIERWEQGGLMLIGDDCSSKRQQRVLDTSRTSFAKPRSLLKPLPEELMDAHDVSSIVNSAKYDCPECIQAVSDDDIARGQLSLFGLLLIAPSLHAVSEDLPLLASASKGCLTLAVGQVLVTTFVNLTLGAVAQSWGLLIHWGLLTAGGC